MVAIARLGNPVGRGATGGLSASAYCVGWALTHQLKTGNNRWVIDPPYALRGDVLLSHQAGQADDEQRRQKPASTDVKPMVPPQPANGGQVVLGLMKIDQRDE